MNTAGPLSIILSRVVLAAVLVGAACTPKKASTPASDSRWPACDPSAATQTISFVHINDMHSNYQLDANGVSPYAIARGYYLGVKAQNPYTLFTSAGDEYEKGAVAEQISKGLSTRAILFGMKFDIRTIGNHDFGWSEEEVLADSRDTYSQVLTASIGYTGNDPLGFGAKPYVEEQVGCVKIGFFGLTTNSYNDRDQSQTIDYYPDMPTNLNFIQLAQAQITAHRNDVDVLIGITHEGASADSSTALSTSGIDIILGGHSHTLLTSIDPADNNGTIITQAGSYATDINRLDITYDLKTKKIINPVYTVTQLEPNITNIVPDPATQTLVTETLNQYAPGSQSPIAHVSAAVTDYSTVATIAGTAGMQRFSADAAIVDVTTVWHPLPAGPISPQDCYNSFEVEREPPGTPGFNSFYTVSIDGASLQALATQSRDGWVVVAPPTIDPTKTYLLVGQKRTLLNPSDYLPAGVSIIGTPVEGVEVWDALSSYATSREKACQYVDVDQTIPGCTP